MSSVDLIVRGGSLIDGTGAPRHTADVAVHHGRVVEIGTLRERGDRELDADGLLVTPGFVDIHTHYDAQLHWDPTASPASWHGVTTLLTGNCGFTIAPAKPDDLDWLLLMLSRVEGMSADALGVGVDFKGGTLADFLDNLEGRVGVNVGVNVGHCAVRRHVMGDDASERAATDDEITEMQQLVRQAMDDGAIGFTSSQLDLHVAHDGRGVPSNYAKPEELIALSSILREFGRGSIEFIPRTFLEGYADDDRALMRAMAHASGRPLHLNTVTRMPQARDGWKLSLDFARQTHAEGLDVHPMFASNRQGVHFALGNTFLFDEMPIFRDTLTLSPPERAQALRDPAVRDQMRAALGDRRGRSFVFTCEALRIESASLPEHQPWLDRPVSEVAAALGRDPFDVFLDLSLAENLELQFAMAATADPKRRAATEELIRSGLVMAGSSDGGAHVLSFCGADFTTRLITEWVPDVLSLEEAIARLTSVPADAYGIADRGRLAPGCAADLNLIDPGRLGTPDAPRYVRDFPAGAGRYVVDASGYVATIVNGEVLLENGTWTGATPGTILRQ